MLYLLGLTLLLCQGIKSDNVNGDRCVDEVFCAEAPDLMKYIDKNVAVVNNSMEVLYDIKTELAQSVCSLFLDTANCIDDSVNIPIICPTRLLGVIHAFQRVVRSGCPKIVTDVISLISCFNTQEVQTGYFQCLHELDVETQSPGNCGLLDLAWTCNNHLAACDAVAVKNVEQFIQDNKADVCVVLVSAVATKKR